MRHSKKGGVEMKTQPSAAKHPLEGKGVTHIQSWGAWKERWEKESCTEILHSLLHFGFGVSADWNEAIERLCLYLEIADNGGERWGVFSSEDDRQFQAYKAFGREVNTKAELREVLTQKAFPMLCQNFFKNTAEHSYSLPSWVRMVIVPQVLAKLFWFFRLNSQGQIQNIRPHLRYDNEHQKKIARDFAYDFCLFVWECGNPGAYHDYREISEDVRTAFYKARPDVITLLAGLGELDLLLKGNRYEEMDKACLKKLESLAFDYDLWLPNVNEIRGDYRKPRTIEEACLGKSQAAHVLLVLRTLLVEKERFDKIRELEEQRREAEKKLTELKK
jgi:hypothetical protein